MSAVRSFVMVLLLALPLGFTQLAGAAEAPIVAGTVSFTDPTGDAGTAPDITAVVVSNDANGRIGFEINVPGQPTLAADALLFLVMNTDGNPVTGAPNTEGSDYYFVLSGEDRTYGLYRWTGSDWADVPSANETVSWASGAHIAFDRSLLGNPDELTFYVKSLQGSGSSEDGRVDYAPDSSTWTYVLPRQIPSSTASPKITSKQVLVVSSGTARAGKSFSIRVTLRLVVDREAYITGPDKLGCAARIAGSRIKTTVTPSPIAWTCSLVIPKTARGKPLTIDLAGKTAVSTDAGDVATSFAKSLRFAVR